MATRKRQNRWLERSLPLLGREEPEMELQDGREESQRQNSRNIHGHSFMFLSSQGELLIRSSPPPPPRYSLHQFFSIRGLHTCATPRPRQSRKECRTPENKVPSAASPVLSKVLSFNAWSGLERSFVCFACCQEFRLSNFCLCGLFSFLVSSPLQI